jgi:hypothetical protein
MRFEPDPANWPTFFGVVYIYAHFSQRQAVYGKFSPKTSSDTGNNVVQFGRICLGYFRLGLHGSLAGGGVLLRGSSIVRERVPRG